MLSGYKTKSGQYPHTLHEQMSAKVSHNAKVRPGYEFIVPTKIQSRMSLAETLISGSSAASIAAVIATIANLLK